MRHVQTFRAWMGIVGALFMLWLSGCVSSQPKEDPQMVAIQRELGQIEKLNAATREKIEEIHSQVQTLEAKVNGVKDTVDEFADSRKPQPLETGPPEEASVAIPVHKPAMELKPKKASGSAKLSPQRQYEKAYGVYTQHLYEEALTMFKNFLQLYPEHKLADNAQYWIGEIYYDMKDYPVAIRAFKEVVTRYTERDKAPDALLKIGYSYIALKDPANARIFLKRVIKDYPFSETEAKARAKLKELKKQ